MGGGDCLLPGDRIIANWPTLLKKKNGFHTVSVPTLRMGRRNISISNYPNVSQLFESVEKVQKLFHQLQKPYH